MDIQAFKYTTEGFKKWKLGGNFKWKMTLEWAEFSMVSMERESYQMRGQHEHREAPRRNVDSSLKRQRLALFGHM